MTYLFFCYPFCYNSFSYVDILFLMCDNANIPTSILPKPGNIFRLLCEYQYYLIIFLRGIYYVLQYSFFRRLRYYLQTG